MSWKNFLEQELQQQYMLDLKSFLKEEYKKNKVYPIQENIFRAFNLVDYDKVRIIILGQDPYHGSGQANGLAFAVNSGFKTPPSLSNIFKEIADDLKITAPADTSLVGWASQGAFLLNTILTVRDNQPLSHANRGWEQFTDTVISKLNSDVNPKVFLLWGGSARKKKFLLSNQKHLILESAHPSPLSYFRGFKGCRHFSKTNDWLLKQYGSTIDWSRSGP